MQQRVNRFAWCHKDECALHTSRKAKEAEERWQGCVGMVVRQLWGRFMRSCEQDVSRETRLCPSW